MRLRLVKSPLTQRMSSRSKGNYTLCTPIKLVFCWEVMNLKPSQIKGDFRTVPETKEVESLIKQDLCSPLKGQRARVTSPHAHLLKNEVNQSTAFASSKSA